MKIDIKKTGKGLDSIKASLAKLDNEKVEAGYFQSQGKHTGADGVSDYSYVALAQALEIGYFPLMKGRSEDMGDVFRTPMPFMKNILLLTKKDLNSSLVMKGATKKWKKTLNDNTSPAPLLDAIGKLMILESKKVFNNPAFFPQAPKNETPLVETGELAQNFTYRNSINKAIRKR